MGITWRYKNLKVLFVPPLAPTEIPLVERNVARCRDLKGWNPAAIAVFHESKAVLELLLQHGADPYLKSSYNKNAWDMAQDELDAAGRVVKSRCHRIEYTSGEFSTLIHFLNIDGAVCFYF